MKRKKVCLNLYFCVTFRARVNLRDTHTHTNKITLITKGLVLKNGEMCDDFKGNVIR